MHASPMYALSLCVNESVAVSWHNINYPIKIEWVINCPSLPALITLAERAIWEGQKERQGRKTGQRRKTKTKWDTCLALCIYTYMRVCMSMCVCWESETEAERRRRPHWRETHVVLTWGPQRLGPQRKVGLLKRRGEETRGERNESVVVYLDMLHSVFNARITIKMLRLISYVYKTARQGCTSAQVMRTEAENRSGSQNVWSLVGRSINE